MICFDASLAGKWYWFEPEADKAQELLGHVLQNTEDIIEPHLLLSEMSNMVYQRIRKQIMSLDEARAVLARVQALPIIFAMPAELHNLAVIHATRFRLRAAYDAHYLALCEITGATFWTADERLYNAVAGALPFVRRLADYQPL